jgi:crotonobetainyl-CoA:carnitine CoA-transferase CaiB-like acyl-CoA transferase
MSAHTSARNVDHRGDGEPGLSSLLVIEGAGSPAIGFACALLADFGARVFVCEPRTGSAMRHLGSTAVQKVWWRIIARNKHSAAIDAEGVSISALAAIAARADLILLDSHSQPNATQKWQAAAAQAKSRPVVVDLHPTGSDRRELWPWGIHSTLTAAAAGMMALTGHSDGPPMQPQFPLAEYLAGVLTAVHALAELRRRGRGAAFQRNLSIGLHEAVQRMIEWQVPIATAFGRPELRNGNNFPMAAGISNIHRCCDGKFVITSAATQSTALRMLQMVGVAEPASDPRFASPESRQRHMGEINALIDRWIGERTLDEVLVAGRRHDVVVGPIFDTADLLADPHVRERQNIVLWDDGGEQTLMPAIIPRIVGRPVRIRHLGPDIGAHTHELLDMAGLSPEQIHSLESAGVVWQKGRE